MYLRLLSWLCVCAFVPVISSRAQAPAKPQVVGGAELVIVAKVSGKVTKTLNGVTTALAQNDQVEKSARINTLKDSSVVLVFSNGATTQLGDETELIIEEFLQDPFAATIKIADLTEEPSGSITRLKLNRGELVGNVKKLKRDRGSTFTVQTPVGAAGIRGTTFRIVFRPTGNGQAFNFQLSTVEGDVGFQTPAQQAAQGGGQTTPGTPAGDGGGGTAVVTGQEVVITVTVEVSATGQVTITAPPTVTTTTDIPPQTQALLAAAAQEIAVTTATTTFSSPPPSAGGGGTTSSNTPATTPEASGTVTLDPTANTFSITTNPPAPPPPPPRVTSGDGLPGTG